MKNIRLEYQSSPIETSKVHSLTLKQKGRKILFEDDLVMQASDEVSQEKLVAPHGGETLANRDITEHEWAI